MRLLGLAIGLAGGLAGVAIAAAQTAPPIEPAALALLKAAGDTLAAAKTLSFTATALQDVPNAEGQTVLYLDRSKVALRRPDSLRVVSDGDGPRSEFTTDGRAMTLFRAADGSVATAPAPAGLDAVLKAEVEAFGQTRAFADMLVADPAKSFTQDLSRAFVVGRSRLVGGVETDIVAFAAPNAQAQMWIGVKDKLPRQLWVTDTSGATPRREGVTFSDWRLDRPIPAGTFSAGPRSGAKTVPFPKPE